MASPAHEVEARRLALAVLLAAIDGRDEDLAALVAEAGRDELAVAVGGLAIAVGAALGEVPPERRAALRHGLAEHALDVAFRDGA
ncbi:MAG TPA: hypothetical protein VFB90_06490 [Dehalococcoidia bacterium]|nr:hypothetical protein [Dehalococcoidia bacterium]